MVYTLLYIIYTIKNEICQLFKQNFLQIFFTILQNYYFIFSFYTNI